MARPQKRRTGAVIATTKRACAMAHCLIVSLDEDVHVDEGMESAWLEEVKKRDTEIERGEVKAVSYGEAMQSVRDVLNKQKRSSVGAANCGC